MADAAVERGRAQALLWVERTAKELRRIEEKIADVQKKKALLARREQQLQVARSTVVDRLAQANDKLVEMNEAVALAEGSDG